MGEQSETKTQSEEREVNFCRLLNFLFAVGEKGSNTECAGQRESGTFSSDKLGTASPAPLNSSKTRVKKKQNKKKICKKA